MSLTLKIERTKTMIKRFIKTVRLPIYQRPVRVAFKIETYLNNGNMAIDLYKPTLRGYEDWESLTVNTGLKLPYGCACINTDKHGKELLDRIVELKLGTPSGEHLKGEFCRYPIVKFNLNRIQKYSVVE